jgi:hypothetical protein
MAKKSVKSRAIAKPKPPTSREIELALIENFVNLQKVLTNLTVKFDYLSDNISKLLQLFEISAKSFIKKQEEPAATEEKELLRKLDTLLDQNKTIAKGLTLIEDKIRHKLYPSAEEISRLEIGTMQRPKPLPRM